MSATAVCPYSATRHHAGVLAHGEIDGTAFDVTLRRIGRAGKEELPPQDRAWPALLRRIGRAHLGIWELEALADTADLLISELVTNAFQHGRGETVGVRLWRSGTHIGIEVAGGAGEETPGVREAGAMEEGGRGLRLVETVADAWGVTEDGDRTWCLVVAPMTPQPLIP